MRRLLVLVVCMSLGACAVTPSTETDPRFAAPHEKIATDTANQLARLYPPAKTQFSVVVSTPASFGTLLSDKLRAKGYAVSESRAAKRGMGALFQNEGFGAAYPPKPAPDTDKQALPPADPATGIALGYVLDHSGTLDFSRITLKIGDSLLARAYLAGANGLAPAGAWTFKE